MSIISPDPATPEVGEQTIDINIVVTITAHGTSRIDLHCEENVTLPWLLGVLTLAQHQVIRDSAQQRSGPGRH